MATTLAQYFIEEMGGWERTMEFYGEELEGLTLKLHEVIQRNSIPHIAEKVERQQEALNKIFEKFVQLQTQLNQQKAALKADGTLVDDSLIKDKIELKQTGLRQNMLQVEKESIEAMTSCRLFLSEVFKNRNKN